MASLVLHGARAVISTQPKHTRSLINRPSNLTTTLNAQPRSWAFQDKCLFVCSKTTSLNVRKQTAVMSVSEEATTEIEGGVYEVEDEASLEQYFQDAGDKLVVLDISTKTCGPCKMIYPKLVRMSKEYPDALFLKINGDNNSSTRALMRKWGVRAVPNFRFFRNGELIHSHTGASEDELRTKFLLHYGETAKV